MQITKSPAEIVEILKNGIPTQIQASKESVLDPFDAKILQAIAAGRRKAIDQIPYTQNKDKARELAAEAESLLARSSTPIAASQVDQLSNEFQLFCCESELESIRASCLTESINRSIVLIEQIRKLRGKGSMA